ncbi:MAG: hypothetical protein DRO88_11125, partial [Promethearchaeia archaeon]
MNSLKKLLGVQSHFEYLKQTFFFLKFIYKIETHQRKVMAIGTLKKLVDWLNGDDDSNKVSSSPHSVSPRIKIKVFNKRLARMISK